MGRSDKTAAHQGSLVALDQDGRAGQFGLVLDLLGDLGRHVDREEVARDDGVDDVAFAVLHIGLALAVRRADCGRNVGLLLADDAEHLADFQRCERIDRRLAATTRRRGERKGRDTRDGCCGSGSGVGFSVGCLGLRRHLTSPHWGCCVENRVVAIRKEVVK